MRRSGWDKAPAHVVEGDETDARKAEIAENLHRAELTVQERAEQIAEWIALTDRETQSAQVAPIESSRSDGRGHRQQSGINAASRDLGIDRTEAQRAVKVASISADAKAAAIEEGLDNNQSALPAPTTPRCGSSSARMRWRCGCGMRPWHVRLGDQRHLKRMTMSSVLPRRSLPATPPKPVSAASARPPRRATRRLSTPGQISLNVRDGRAVFVRGTAADDDVVLIDQLEAPEADGARITPPRLLQFEALSLRHPAHPIFDHLFLRHVRTRARSNALSSA
jgi:hypothetical protein